MQEKISLCLSGKLYYFIVLSNITVSYYLLTGCKGGTVKY